MFSVFLLGPYLSLGHVPEDEGHKQSAEEELVIVELENAHFIEGCCRKLYSNYRPDIVKMIHYPSNIFGLSKRASSQTRDRSTAT